jgi:hypothetical protein
VPPAVLTTAGSSTPVAGGDGERIRKAINDYSAWFNNHSPNRPPLSQIQARMREDLTPTYNADASAFIDYIAGVVSRGTRSLPKTDSDTLGSLQIQKQCLEWVITTAVAAGGRPKGYSADSLSNPKACRPGMGLYWPGKHAMIITDIRSEWPRQVTSSAPSGRRRVLDCPVCQ